MRNDLPDISRFPLLVIAMIREDDELVFVGFYLSKWRTRAQYARDGREMNTYYVCFAVLVCALVISPGKP